MMRVRAATSRAMARSPASCRPLLATQPPGALAAEVEEAQSDEELLDELRELEAVLGQQAEERRGDARREQRTESGG